MTTKLMIRNPKKDIPNLDGQPLVAYDPHFRSNAEALAWYQMVFPDLLEACEAAYQNLKPAYSSDHLVMRKLNGAIKQATD